MNTLSFKSESAQKIYLNYLKRVRKMTAILSEDDSKELLMEINSHIFEGIQRNQGNDEVETLLNLLDNLGEPEDFLKPMVAERKLQEATRTYNPRHIFQALKLNLQSGAKYSVFAILYLFLFAFIFLPFAKIIFPKHTGLFYRNDEFLGFGFIKDIIGADELLGFWFIPICIITGLLLYVLITLLLRLTNKG